MPKTIHFDIANATAPAKREATSKAGCIYIDKFDEGRQVGLTISLRKKIQVCSKNHRLRVLFFACTIEKKWTNNSTVFLQQWPQSWPVSSKTPFMICRLVVYISMFL
tara:strand:- start:1973 stop:2293 length:321 start_codon:yes stop_codon:yes gene_type:complete